MKATPLTLLRAQYATYVDDRTGRQRWRDHVAFHGLPLITFFLFCWFEVTIPTEASIGIVTVAGFLSAFLFGAMLQVSQRSLDWLDNKPTPSEDTTQHGEYLRQLAANTGYASLVSIATAAMFVISSAAKSPEVSALSSAVGFAFVLHLLLVLLMVMNRVFALTINRVIQAETGGPSITRTRSRPRTRARNHH